MVKQINTAVIGLGMFGGLQAQVYAESPLSELKAVVSRTPERAREIGERFDANWYTDFREMLEKERDLEAVSIVNRDAEHKEPAIACAQAGKDIFLEKPMAPTLEEADEIIEAVQKAGVRMMVNFTLRFDPTYVAAYERIQAGEIGDVVTMFARRNGTLPGAQHYGQWSDMLISTGIHEIDAMTWYADSKVKRVYGESEKRLTMGLRGDDAYMALLRFENGAIGSLESSWILPATEPAGLNSRFDIVGTKGGIYIDNVNKRLAIINEERYYHPDISYWPVLQERAVGDLRESMTHFLTCLVEDKEPIVGGKEGRQALQLVLAIQESCRTEKVVEII